MSGLFDNCVALATVRRATVQMCVCVCGPQPPQYAGSKAFCMVLYPSLDFHRRTQQQGRLVFISITQRQQTQFISNSSCFVLLSLQKTSTRSHPHPPSVHSSTTLGLMNKFIQGYCVCVCMCCDRSILSHCLHNSPGWTWRSAVRLPAPHQMTERWTNNK